MRVFVACLLVGVAVCFPAVQQSEAPGVEYWYQADQDSDSQSQQASGHKVAYGGPYGAGGSYHVPLTQLGEQGVVEAPSEDEPFFTDVSDLEPVYDYNSKSRYQTGRVVYYQTRYNPTEPLYDMHYGGQYPPTHTDSQQYVPY